MTGTDQGGPAFPGNGVRPSGVRPVWKRLLGILVFACAMGLLEAICVIYLRRLIIPADAPNAAAVSLSRLPVEPIREACTLVMLASVAWMTAANWRTRTAHFFFMFGAWDILYYVGLKWLAHWPASWLQWDCLFLIPKPWHGPVLAPLLISAYLMLACCLLLVREDSGTRTPLSPLGLALQLAAVLVWYVSFVKDSDRIAAHGYAGVRYSYALLAVGLALAVPGLWLGARTDRRGRRSSPEA